jgi:hypothetical protein
MLDRAKSVAVPALLTGFLLSTPVWASGDSVSVAAKRGYLPVCAQPQKVKHSRGDLNVLRGECPKGRRLKLALWPVKGEPGPAGQPGTPGAPGQPGTPGQPGAPGAAGVTDTRIVSATSATNAATPKSARAICPVGTVITGGGFSSSVLSTDLVLRRSTPQGDSWSVDLAEGPGFPNGIAWSVTANAICAEVN